MLAYLTQRLVSACVTLVIVSFFGFILINLPPGTYLDVRIAELQVMGTSTATEQIEALRARFGLDKPWYVQYWKWATGFLKGDYGRSFRYNREVRELIGDRIWMTIAVASATVVFSWVVAIPIGIYTAVHKNSLGDYIANVSRLYRVVDTQLSLSPRVSRPGHPSFLGHRWPGSFRPNIKTLPGAGPSLSTFSNTFGFRSSSWARKGQRSSSGSCEAISSTSSICSTS